MGQVLEMNRALRGVPCGGSGWAKAVEEESGAHAAGAGMREEVESEVRERGLSQAGTGS